MFSLLRNWYLNVRYPSRIEAAIEPIVLDTFSEPIPTVPMKAGDGTLLFVQKSEAEPNASVKYSKRLTDGMRSSYGPVLDFTTLRCLNNTVRRDVWIYNVSTLPFEINHPFFGRKTIPGRQKNQEYSTFGVLPEVVAVPIDNAASGTINFCLEDGKRIAMDAINPDNLGLNQDLETKYSTSGSTNNLSARGVFWSMHNPPLKKEIIAAKKRMGRRYKQLLDQVKTIIMSNPRELVDLITPELFAAADYYGLGKFWREHIDAMKAAKTTQEKK